jgi:hypothetical protein
VLRDEPLTRGNGGKPHRADFCYRNGLKDVAVITFDELFRKVVDLIGLLEG